MKKYIKRLFDWVFEDELKILKGKIASTDKAIERLNVYEHNLKKVLQSIDVSVDVHESRHFSDSWAVVSIQGKRSDFIKFVNLREHDAVEIERFLRNFDRDTKVKIDASPSTTGWLKASLRNYYS